MSTWPNIFCTTTRGIPDDSICVRFTNFNVQHQCTPIRSAIHTGRLPIRSGTQKVPAPGEPQGMAPWEYTIAELLSDSGYATAAYGKWHLGDKDSRLPNDQGYDEGYGIKESAMLASFTSTPQFDPDVIPIPHIWQGKKGSKSKKVKEFNLEARSLLDSEVVAKSNAFLKAQADKGMGKVSDEILSDLDWFPTIAHLIGQQDRIP